MSLIFVCSTRGTSLLLASSGGPLFLFFCFIVAIAIMVISLQTEAAVDNAVKLDGSEFKGRQLKVTSKRVNQPGFAAGGRGGRGGGRGEGRGGRGGYRGGFRGRGRGGFRGGGRGGGGEGRGGGGYQGGEGRGGGGYHPYY
jgi:hypothetical protein